MNKAQFDWQEVSGSSRSGTQKIAQFIASGVQLPEPVYARALELILDTVCCCLGALQTPLGSVVAKQSILDGNARHTIFGLGKVSDLFSAAYANGRLANILDFDETFMGLGHHASSTLAGALAACEHANAAGCDFVRAFTVGFEVGARVGLSTGPHLEVDENGKVSGWNYPGPVMGVMGACAAACSALKLSPEQVQNALGIAATYLPRSWTWPAHCGPATARMTSIKYEDAGWNAQAGLRAAMMARDNVTGPWNALDELIYSFISNRSCRYGETLVEDCPEWAVELTSIKPWPCCRLIHYPLTALQGLLIKENLASSEIDAIEIATFDRGRGEGMESVDLRGDSVVEATFSYQHAVAMAVMRVEPGMQWFSDAAVSGDEPKRLRRRTSTVAYSDASEPSRWALKRGGRTRLPVRVTVEARGKSFVAQGDVAWGDPNISPAWNMSDTRSKLHAMCRSIDETAGLICDADKLATSLEKMRDPDGLSLFTTNSELRRRLS